MNCGTRKDSYLDKLKTLTARLNQFPVPESTHGEGSNGYAEYDLGSGSSFSWVIHRSGNDISIHRWFITRGSILKNHVHTEREWLIIYRGEMVVEIGDTKTHLKKGESMMVEPGVLHSSTYPEDCRFISVTIPTSKDFYHGS